MAGSRFVLLARLERQGMITACRHGQVHLMWRNVTVRLEFDAFRRLARLLDAGRTHTMRIPLCDGDMAVSTEEADYRVAVGQLELVLEAEQYLALTELARNGLERLERIVASGEWPEPASEPPGLAPADESYTPRHWLS